MGIWGGGDGWFGGDVFVGVWGWMGGEGWNNDDLDCICFNFRLSLAVENLVNLTATKIQLSKSKKI